MNNNNNKKKIVIGSAIGAVLLLLIIVSVAYSKGNNKNTEVANTDTEKVNIDNVISDVANVSQGNLVVETDTNKETANQETLTTETPNTENTNKETSNQEQVASENTNTEKTNTETSNPTTANGITVVSDWGTPQEYNGDPEGRGPGRIIVKGFDYNDFQNGMSWKGEYWTASNGVEIKVLSVEGKDTGMIAVPDGKGKDNEPTSPFQVAIDEAMGIDANKYAADLNVTIPLASYKRTEIDINDADLVAYRDAYDYKLWARKGEADLYKPYVYGEQINLRYAVASDGIGEYDSVGAKFWEIFKVNDYWEVKINGMLSELQWDGVHQALRYLTPDGDTLYEVFYEDCITGSPVILEYDEWFAVGNSQIYQKDTTNMGYIIYYFK